MVNVEDVLRARTRISSIVKETPILTSKQLSEKVDANVFLKSEHLQTTGSFKIRGATNRVTQAKSEGTNFITAASSGNHGQAVAYIANQLGIPATIVVPTDALSSKVNAIKAYHGSIEYCGTTSAERIPRAIELAEDSDGVFIPPYDHPDIIAGQGTVGLEILEQVEEVDTIIVPVGGGGLSSGILTAVKEKRPDIRVVGVEPEIGDDTAVSLKKGQITSVKGTDQTIADGLRTTQPGDLTFPILQKYLDDLVLVSEDEIRFAMSFVMERMKQLIESSSATTVAAAMFGKANVVGQNVVCVISGGNVDIQKLDELLVNTGSDK
ncbi:threonine ammonia-lyase [Tenuibacillus multivorans]|uniref:threonine ammonia-lyase n=1 Tax=Tenuibacillus multivorans TaxID=237069 RepID=A0A1H0AZI4_9BACI|nr:threonine/serine dehydratase [Tenuibacillus multivorans]GEL77595.1 serine/threonine dehydratase [Tenuibacillus multivorans]SDN38887.1 threonine dehydratase [Tenuibacillus multivorans]